MKTQVLRHHLQDVQSDINNWGETKTLIKNMSYLKIMFDNINTHINV